MSRIKISYEHPANDPKKLSKALTSLFAELLLEMVDRIDMTEEKKRDTAVEWANLLMQSLLKK